MDTARRESCSRTLAVGLAAIVMGVVPAAARGSEPIVFEDVTERVGLAELLAGWEYGHAGAWGDVTGNGRPDLYLGAFAGYPLYAEPDAPLPNMLLLNGPEGFTLAPDEGVRFDGDRATTSMALFVDLNNNGALDLLVGTHNTIGKGPGSQLFANAWPEPFDNVTDDATDWPHELHMRNATAVDLDHDGLLDLLLLDGRYQGDEQGVVALRNLGDFQFQDVSESYGFPPGQTPGLGSAVGDINNNGRLDLFVAHANRMFITRDDGTYIEHGSDVFQIPDLRPHDWPCGAALADLTGNGLLDLVLTIHTHVLPEHLSHVFVYVNRGIDERGMPEFEEVTDAAGLGDFRLPQRGLDMRRVPALGVEADEPVAIDLRAAQVALVDLNNNGRRDILLGMLHRDERGDVQPVVLRNRTTVDGVPQFDHPPVDEVFGYYATAPITDYDRDGRVDVFMANWHDTLPSLLLRNITDADNYLVVRVRGESEDLNPMGVGATVRLYEAGHAGDPDRLLGRGDITIANGYSSGDEAQAHFGLGSAEHCDVVVTWQGRELTLRYVSANQYLNVSVGEAPVP